DHLELVLGDDAFEDEEPVFLVLPLVLVGDDGGGLCDHDSGLPGARVEWGTDGAGAARLAPRQLREPPADDPHDDVEVAGGVGGGGVRAVEPAVADLLRGDLGPAGERARRLVPAQVTDEAVVGVEEGEAGAELRDYEAVTVADAGAGAFEHALSHGPLVGAVEVVDLEAAVAAVGHVELGLGAAGVDPDGMGAVEPAGALLAAEAHAVAAVRVVAVDEAHPVPVGHPHVAAAAVAPLVDGDPRRCVAAGAVGREVRRVEREDGLAVERELGDFAGVLVGDPEELPAVLLDEGEAVRASEPVAPGAGRRAVRLQHDDGGVGLPEDDDAAVGRDGDAVRAAVRARAGGIGEPAPPGNPLEGVVRYGEVHARVRLRKRLRSAGNLQRIPPPVKGRTCGARESALPSPGGVANVRRPAGTHLHATGPSPSIPPATWTRSRSSSTSSTPPTTTRPGTGRR